ncbi:hypothetical protein CPB83DRAFT_857195 [Crepidotus variabilis]|uniref:DUF6699 domain-containing protein n=1 Tax=Crepidotus variabilis TaxID=179855 RepID=A0A9P6ED63_9AGAR|nr:hypothetical protein CPB83DRAFT_857195 [Crepidotus variabilis]
MSWNPHGWAGHPTSPYGNPGGYIPAGFQPNPQVWYPPTGNAVPSSPPANNQQRSAKYPSLNPILAEDTTLLRFDLKMKPSLAIMTSVYYSHRPMIVFAKQTQKMRLISKSFPWTIDIESLSPVTVEDVWEAMYGALQQPIMESEWGFIVRDGKKRKEIEGTMKKRLTADPNTDKRALRIDYLGETTLFRGMEKDDEFAKAALLPGAKSWLETWVIKLIS